MLRQATSRLASTPTVTADVGGLWYSCGMTNFELVPAGPFSLAASAAFLEGWSPAAYRAAGAGHLHLAFVPDGEEAAAGVCLRQPDGPDGAVTGEVFGDVGPEAVRDQVARALSLDVDGRGFPDVGRRDPVVGGLQARWPGLRPVGFCSPYEAAAWALIGHRIQMVQAARIKQRLAEELGEVVDIHGDKRHAFPGPARLAGLEGFRGCSRARSRTSAPWARRRWRAGSTGPGCGSSPGTRPSRS
jgi:DNA-3-methyladenine glycosylase II